MSKFFPRLIVVVTILLIFIGSLVALLPMLLQSDWGRNQALHWINRSIPGRIEIERLDLNWGSGQTIEGIVLNDPEGQSVLKVEKFSTEAPLWKIILRKPSLGLTTIHELNASIATNEQGESNLQRALGISSKESFSGLMPSTIVLSHVNIEGDLFPADRPLSIQFKGLTQQEEIHGSFDVQLALVGLWSSDWKNFKKDAQNYFNDEGRKEAKFNARIENFPVDLFDRLIAIKNPSLNGIFHSFLGDRLNILLDKEPSREGLGFNLTLLSPLMQGDLKGLINKDILTLKEPAVFHLDIVPHSIQQWIDHRVTLKNTPRIELVFSDLYLPMDLFHQEKGVDLDPCLLALKAEITLPETELVVKDVGNLTIKNLQSNLNALTCDKLIHLEVIGQANKNGEPFDLHFTSTMNKPTQLSNIIPQTRQSLHSTLTISKFPLQLIPLFHQHPEWSEALGSHINAQLDIYPVQDEWTGILSFQTPNFVLKEAQLNFGKKLTLMSPAIFHCNLKENCLPAFFKNNQFMLEESARLNLIINQFQYSFENSELTKILVETSIPHLRFPKLISWGIAQLDDVVLKIEKKSSRQFESNLTGQFSLFEHSGNLSPFLPKPLNFHQLSTWDIGKKGLKAWSGQINLQNAMASFQAEALMNSTETVELTQSIRMNYTLSPQALELLSRRFDKNWPALQEPAKISLNIEPKEFNLKSFSLSDLYLQGFLKVDRIAFKDSSGKIPALEEVFIPWVIDSSRNNIYTTFKALAYHPNENKSNQISAHLQFWLSPGRFNFSHFPTEMRLNLTGMPTSLINLAFDTPELSDIFGPIIDLNVVSLYDPISKLPGSCDVIVDSTNFHIDGKFKLDQHITIFDHKKSPNIRLTVTPQSYQQIKNLLKFTDDRQLSHPFVFSGTLLNFDFPLDQTWTRKGTFDFKFASTDIQWINGMTDPLKLEGSLSSSNLAHQLDFSAKILGKTSLLLDGSLLNLFDSSGHLRPWQEMGLKGKLNGEKLTPAFLHHLLPMNIDQKSKAQALFGETFDIAFLIQFQKLNGFLQGQVQGTNGNIHLDGQLRNGILTLQKPFEGSLKVTPLFVQSFLAKNVPLLGSVIEAENPLTFSIEPLDFSCPLFPFRLEKIRIGNGNINFGKLILRNEGELSSVLNFIRPNNDRQLTIWFTPIYFKLDKGILSLKRFDMLVGNSYTLANWGSINLSNQQANFILGLSAQTLQFAFGIQGLDEKLVFQIPLHLAQGKVELDKKKATTKIGSLLAQTHGGNAGKLFGNILDIALSDQGEPYPSPTTTPFPWHKEFKSPSQSSKIKTDVPRETSEELDQIQPKEKKDNRDKKDKKDKKKKKKNSLLDESNLKSLSEGALQILDQWLPKE